MRKNFFYHIIFLSIALSSLMSCVEDNVIELPDTSRESFISSNNLITLLNTLAEDNLSDNSCFEFVYPIALGYNNQATITVEDEEGLSEVLASQSNVFNITALVFPIEVLFQGETTTRVINTEEGLLKLISDCGFTTLREDFENLWRQCFYLAYPVTALDTQTTEVTLDSDEDFERFLNSQGEDYQPDFIFPVTFFVGRDSVVTEITSVYEIYDVINACEGCPNVDFNTNEIEPGQFRFETDPLVEATYSWTIDDIPFQEINGPIFEYDFFVDDNQDLPFGPGTYRVCLEIKTPDCPSGQVVCQIVEVSDNCPEYTLEVIQDGSLYIINANGDVQIPYIWTFNGDPAEVDGGNGADNQLTRELRAPGTYEICVRNDPTTSCPNGVEVCEEIVVEPQCLEPLFTSRVVDAPFFYQFTAEFPEMTQTSYQWFINDEFQEDDGGANGDQQFTYNFPDTGAYEVCIKISSTIECPEGTEFCQQIVICPSPFFNAMPEGQGYFFEAQFPEMDQINYEWILNDQKVGDGGGNPNNNTLFVDNLNAGNYEMCLRIPASENICPDGTEFCLEFEIQ